MRIREITIRGMPRDRLARRALRTLAGVPIALAVALWVWAGSPFKLKDSVFPRRFATVEGGRVYRSARIEARLIGRVLDVHDIGAVLDLTPLADYRTHRRKRELQETEMQAAAARGIEHVRVGLRGDGTGRIDRYADAVETLTRAYAAGTPILVHCGGGRRRSAGVIAAFQLLVQGRPPEVARAELGRFLDERAAERLGRFLDGALPAISDELARRGVALAARPLPRLYPTKTDPSERGA